MEYERVILELLSRIQKLEDQVSFLLSKQEDIQNVGGKSMSVNDIREYINELKKSAKEKGKNTLILRSGDIHKDLGLKQLMPSVCKAMYDCMKSGDVILHTTPKGRSSTIEIEYKL